MALGGEIATRQCQKSRVLLGLARSTALDSQERLQLKDENIS